MLDIMIKKILILSLLVFGLAHNNSTAETNDSLYHLTLTGAFGYGYFINDFTTVPSEKISNHLPAFIARVMWEPEHFLKLGIESGYYWLYEVHDLPSFIGNDKLRSSTTLLPFFLNVTMRIYGNLYATIVSGYTIMYYNVESEEGKSIGSDLSLSNYALGLSYIFSENKKWKFGAEFRYMRLNLTEDNYLNLNVFATFDIISY